MNRKAIAFLFVFLFLSNNLYSQGENNIWCISDSNLVDITNTNIISSISSLNPINIININENNSTISDRNGNLLFYTDGEFVWNRNHNIMANGFGLSGAFSSTQSSCIVKQPGNSNLYYIFTTNSIEDYTTPIYKGLCYSIVDMNLNGGLGDVIPTSKNILLMNPSCEKVAATFHANQRDIWIVSREMWTNKYWTYLLTPSGIIDSVSSICGKNFGTSRNDNATGCIKISHNSKLIATSFRGSMFELYNFDNNNGNISYLLSDSNSMYGNNEAEFSKNNQYLYVNNYNDIYQYKLNILNKDSILNTKIKIEEGPSYISNLYLASDDKIYFSRFEYNFLGVINYPDSIGLKSKSIKNGLKLKNKKDGGLQNIYYFHLPSIYSINTCLDDTTRFHISDTSWMSKIVWDFGDGTGDTSFYPKHVYSDTGTYHVTATYYYYTCDSVRVQSSTVHIKDKPSITLFNDGFKCASDYNFIRVSGVFDSILWDDGTKDTLKHIDNIGGYSVKAYNRCGIDSTNIYIPAPHSFDVDIIADKRTVALGDEVSLTVNTTSFSPIMNYVWYENGVMIDDTCSYPILCNTIKRKPTNSTTYLVDAFNLDTCYNSDTIRITVIDNKTNWISSTWIKGTGNYMINNLQANTSFEIYNSLGQLIYRNYKYDNNWNPDSLATGIYFYKIKVENGNIFKGKILFY
jgi:hypothetical protein